MSTNGKRATRAAEPTVVERKRGMAAVREAELWHLGSLIEDALQESANLAGEVYRAASNARLSRGTENVASVDEVEAVRKLEEALMCAETGEHYLRMALDQVPYIPADQEPVPYVPADPEPDLDDAAF